MEHDRFPACLSLGSPTEDPETKTSVLVVYLESDAESTSREERARQGRKPKRGVKEQVTSVGTWSLTPLGSTQTYFIIVAGRAEESPLPWSGHNQSSYRLFKAISTLYSAPVKGYC